MKKVYTVPQHELIEALAVELKKLSALKAPDWTEFVKTGAHKQRPPAREDWWYVRAAAVLRSVYTNGPVGVSKLRKKYGGKRNRGVKPEHFYKGSGKIIRKIFQQLEEAGLVAKSDKGIHKGRIIAPKGESLIDTVAARIIPTAAAEKAEKPVEKPTDKGSEAKKPAQKPADGTGQQ